METVVETQPVGFQAFVLCCCVLIAAATFFFLFGLLCFALQGWPHSKPTSSSSFFTAPVNLPSALPPGLLPATFSPLIIYITLRVLPSQSVLSAFICQTSDWLRPSDVLVPDPVHAGHSESNHNANAALAHWTVVQRHNRLLPSEGRLLAHNNKRQSLAFADPSWLETTDSFAPFQASVSKSYELITRLSEGRYPLLCLVLFSNVVVLHFSHTWDDTGLWVCHPPFLLYVNSSNEEAEILFSADMHYCYTK